VTRPEDAKRSLLLSRTERAAIRLADFCARRLPGLHVAASFFPMGAVVWMGIGRRLRLQGIEHVRALPAASSVLLVANHRSFFDFFVVVVVLRLRAGFRHRMFFPVRSEFFYDRPLGVLVNLVAAGMSMFPPVFRHGPKRALNRWSLARCAEELARPGTAVGVHPEGTRNKGPDPFLLMPARPGAGRIALAVPDARVLPVFVLGLGNRVLDEIARNLVAPGRHPVRLSFGPEVDLEDLRLAGNATAARSASERCRAAIQALADRARAETAEARGGAER
jgi:1-acyl-sn-glycerol-3-phosphate acyltransferase